MLNDLYRYAISHNLSARPGFKMRTVNGYILLAADGSYLGVEKVNKIQLFAPDLGTVVRGPAKCNFPLEKADIIFDFQQRKASKTLFYRKALSEAANYEPRFVLCRAIIDDEAVREQIVEDMNKASVKQNDAVTFKIDGISVIDMDTYYEWWDKFRYVEQETNNDSPKAVCFITGKETVPVKTVPPVSGLMAVDGHTNGDSLICFDKDAFCSYGFSKAANASVSEEAITAVNAALYELIGKAKIHAGAKLLHWYKMDVSSAEDIIALFDCSSIADVEDDEVSEEETAEKEAVAEMQADRLITSLRDGVRPEGQLTNEYYMLSLGGANGRVIVRYYLHGRYEDLFHSFSAWYRDLSLINYAGTGRAILPKLNAIYYKLLKKGSDQKLNERIKKELAGLDMQLMYAIVNNTPLPDEVASRALMYIRSDMLQNQDDSKRMKKPNVICVELLKAWLNRKKRWNKESENLMTEEMNPEYRSLAYHTGRMMAVYAYIQKAALGEVNAGVVERYYTSAGTAPALVMGRLADLAMHHLAKMERGLAVEYSCMVNEIAQNITEAYPVTFTLMQKSEYALGYYHQCAAIEKYWKEKKENKKNKAENMLEEEN